MNNFTNVEQAIILELARKSLANQDIKEDMAQALGIEVCELSDLTLKMQFEMKDNPYRGTLGN